MTQISFEARLAWSGRSVRSRLRVVSKFRGLLAERADWIAKELAEATTSRPPGSAGVAEVLTSQLLPLCGAARFLEREAGSWLRPQKLGWRGRPVWLVGVRSEIRREALGTVLVIAAGNYPLFLPGVQALQALVAGNAVVWKPGRGGTAAADWFADLMGEAGLPSGLLLVEDESIEAAERWLSGGADKVFLTGSAASGRAVLSECAETLTPACLELSGCDAVFVLDGADVELAAKAVAFGLRLNGSQTCIAPRRLLIPPEVEATFVAALKREVEAGGAVAWDAGVVERVWPSVEAAVEAGAEVVCGQRPEDSMRGLPVVLAGVTEAMALPRSDVFAPIVSVMACADAAGMLATDAACPYALGASVFGPRKLAERFAERVAAGSVTVNDLIVPTADPRLPFGGRGLSGFGVTRGAEGLLEMTRIKTVSVAGGLLGWVDRWVGRPHYDPAGEHDAAVFAAFVKVAHGGSIVSRLAGLPALVKGLKAVSKKQKQEAPMDTDAHG